MTTIRATIAPGGDTEILVMNTREGLRDDVKYFVAEA